VLDYEQQSRYVVKVRALDTVTGKHADVEVAIAVTDSNDHAPRFPAPFINVSVSEGIAIATQVGTSELLVFLARN
jgi:ethanolamine utilization protein EutP (predicted NTPase)